MIIREFPDFSAQPRVGLEDFSPAFGWPNAVIHARNKELYYPEHEGPLSILCNFRGEAEYHVRGRSFAVNDSSYLLLNDGQRFSNIIHSETDVESLHIWFESGFAGRILRDLVTPADRLLDEPEPANQQPIQFLEKTYPHGGALTLMLLQIRAGIASDIPGPGWLEEQFHLLLERLMDVHRGVRAEIDRLPAVRRSTRVELYRRLHIARDFIDSRIGSQVMLNEMARTACLSPFHFLRLFKQIFGVTPHQYLTTRRL
ncbi:MAG: AraC family transcriptional regulator, partial [Candidatus Kapaibacterium sp.]